MQIRYEERLKGGEEASQISGEVRAEGTVIEIILAGGIKKQKGVQQSQSRNMV